MWHDQISTLGIVDSVFLVMSLWRLEIAAFICHSILEALYKRQRWHRTVMISSVQSLSCVDSLRPHGLQHARPSCPSPTPKVYSDSCPLSQWCHPTSSSSVVPFSSCLFSQHQGLFKWVSSSHHVAKVLEFQLQHQPFQWMFRTDFT